MKSEEEWGDFKMDNYTFSNVELRDIDKIVEIYNSNLNFLMAHMGVSRIYIQ